MTTFNDLFSDDEWRSFTDLGDAKARREGGRFILDEAILALGERSWAAYIKQTMIDIGAPDLAQRINPNDFGEPIRISG